MLSFPFGNIKAH